MIDWDGYDAYIDAVIEDTVHCKLCGCTMVLGDPDCLHSERGGASVCIECAAEIAKEYREAVSASGVCEHGVNEGDWCPECNAAYKAARKENGDDVERHNAWVEELKGSIEWEPLRDFVDKLKEPPDAPQ